MEHQYYYSGSEIKATDNGVVKGYAVRFGNPSDTDLEADYFTKNTDFGRPLKKGDKFQMNLYYHHGQDNTIKSYAIGSGIATYDDTGIWFEAQLNMADKYAVMINELAKQGKLGYSSGSAGHLVSRTQKGTSFEVKSWPIAEISLTPTPAESRNKVFKSLSDFVDACYPKEDGMDMYKPKKDDGMEEEMPEEPIVLPDDPNMLVDVLFEGYEGELVSEAIHELFEKMCEGLYVVLEEGKDISYVNALIDGFSSRAKNVAENIYNVVPSEMAMLKSFRKEMPETIRDLEKKMRDVFSLSNNQAKVLSGIVWSHLRDVDETPATTTETVENVKTVDEVKQALLKRAMLDLL
jgi:HK97 family phage prohead protease